MEFDHHKTYKIDSYQFGYQKDPVIQTSFFEDFWVMSDLHFGHRNILSLEPIRSLVFESVEHMDLELIRLWNAKVQKDDVCILLGDISFHGSKITETLIRMMNGRKSLVMGNHDSSRTVSWWSKFFVNVWNGPIVLGDVLLSHIPVSPAFMEKHKARLNVHGHTHAGRIDDPRYRCVSVEQIGFEPVLFGKIINKIVV